MTSKSQTQNAFLAPAALSPAASPQQQPSPSLPRRQATLYDAVAGRCTQQGLSTIPSAHTLLPPEAVLFQRAGAPDRYEETDTYFASSLLPSSALPSSDLLKALHAYAADYYASQPDGRRVDYRSMDETALLALGVLMEELCRAQLGEEGDLVFTEGEIGDGGAVNGRERKAGRRTRSVSRAGKRRKVSEQVDG